MTGDLTLEAFYFFILFSGNRNWKETWDYFSSTENCVRTFSRSIKDMMRNYVQKLKEGSTLYLQQGLKLSVSQEQGVNALHNWKILLISGVSLVWEVAWFVLWADMKQPLKFLSSSSSIPPHDFNIVHTVVDKSAGNNNLSFKLTLQTTICYSKFTAN